jgi:hypothetical protein
VWPHARQWEAAKTEQPVAVFVDNECGDVLSVPVVCTWTASDARLTGMMTHEWIRPSITAQRLVTAQLSDDDVAIGWADVKIEGPEGDWTGHQYAVWTDPTQLFIVLSGECPYVGWRYVASTIDPGAAGDGDWTGILYQVELPPFGPAADPASE